MATSSTWGRGTGELHWAATATAGHLQRDKVGLETATPASLSISNCAHSAPEANVPLNVLRQVFLATPPPSLTFRQWTSFFASNRPDAPSLNLEKANVHVALPVSIWSPPYAVQEANVQASLHTRTSLPVVSGPIFCRHVFKKAFFGMLMPWLFPRPASLSLGARKCCYGFLFSFIYPLDFLCLESSALNNLQVQERRRNSC